MFKETEIYWKILVFKTVLKFYFLFQFTVLGMITDHGQLAPKLVEEEHKWDNVKSPLQPNLEEQHVKEVQQNNESVMYKDVQVSSF